MALYYFVYALLPSSESPVLIGIHTDEEKAYDLLQSIKADEKWVQRIKTEQNGLLVK